MTTRRCSGRGEDLARALARVASRSGEHEDTVLPDGGGEQPQAARRRYSRQSIRPLDGPGRPETPTAYPSRPYAPGRPPRHRHIILYTARPETRSFNSPTSHNNLPSMTTLGLGAQASQACWDSISNWEMCWWAWQSHAAWGMLKHLDREWRT